MIEYKKAFSLLSEVGGTPPLFAAQQAKEALKKSIRAVCDRFCCKLRLENRRNTLSACRKSPRHVIARSAATWQSNLEKFRIRRKIYKKRNYSARLPRPLQGFAMTRLSFFDSLTLCMQGFQTDKLRQKIR